MTAGRHGLVVGVGGRPEGDDAVTLGKVLAEVTGAAALVATAVPWPPYSLRHEDVGKALELATADEFARITAQMLPLEVECRAVADRHPAKALHELAEAEGSALIVVGSSHRGALGRILLGDVGRALLHGAPCAVAVAPRGYADAERRLLRIGVAFDGSPEAWPALETGIGLAERLHASLAVLAVAEPPKYGYSGSIAAIDPAALGGAERRDTERLLNLGRARVPADLPVEGRVLSGLPARVLAEASGDLDLMICGSRGYGPIRRTVLGSTAHGLMHGAACPVVVLARGIGLDPLGVAPAAFAHGP